MSGLAGGSGRGGLCLSLPAPSSRSDSEPPARKQTHEAKSSSQSVSQSYVSKSGIKLRRVLTAMFHDRRHKSRRSTELVQEEVVVEQSGNAVSHKGQLLGVFEQSGSTDQLGT
jgi:hypothetical protein